MLLNTAVALLPVLLFLTALVLMDSFKLARPSAIAAALFCGVLAALVSDAAYDPLMRIVAVSPSSFSRYVAPVTEETAKAIFIIYLISRRRIGFPVDAAQLGFAVGAGFAVVENVQSLRIVAGASIVLWLVRGLGTAVLHGATTAIFAMVSKTAADRHPERKLMAFLPGWAIAVIVHSAFNHLPLPPAAMTLLILRCCRSWGCSCSTTARRRRRNGWAQGSTSTSSFCSSCRPKASRTRAWVRTCGN
jgi:RsiW-degrading membrane proteinase PrsW (M82 family)